MDVFLRYLRGELRHRVRQVLFAITGLAVGVGLVVTASAAAAGTREAQATVLRAIYGVGTDVTVTRPWSLDASTTPHQAQSGPNTAAQHLDFMQDAGQGLFDATTVPAVAALPHVSAALGWIALVDTKIDQPAGGGPASMNPIEVDGVDPAHPALGPLSQATLVAGRALRGPHDVLVDATYAAANALRLGSSLVLGHQPFTVVGLVRQPPGSSANVLIPLPIATQLAGAAGKVNTISVAVASAADVGAVAKRIRALLPWAVVTTSSSLAGDLTGSLDDASRLANSLGRWVSVAALLAAVALAALLTLAAVSRRVREFGTLKALGWRSRRVVGQVVGESAVVGLCGAALGVALGFGGAALVSALAPSLTARVAYAPGQHEQQAMLTTASNGVAHSRTFDAPGTYHTVPVHFSAPVPAAVLLLAVVLGVLGALLAGAAGGWRAARLRPAAALTAVG